MKRKDFTLQNKDGLNLAVIEEFSEGKGPFPTVVLVHGYASGKNAHSNQALVDRLHAQGIATVRFDFRGHYDSEGKIEDVNISTGLEDLEAITKHVLADPRVDRERLGIYGSSYGGVVTEVFASRNPIFTCIVLKAPATDWNEGRRLRLGDDVMREWRNRGVYTFTHQGKEIPTPYSLVEDIASYDVYEETASIKVPVLIVHGDKDESVPLDQSKKLAEAIGANARLIVYPGASHRFTTGDNFEKVADDMASFFTEELQDG